MKKIKDTKFKAPMIILGLILFFSFSVFLIKETKAETYNQSFLKDFLQVIKSGSFGGGIVTGLDSPEYGLIVASGKVAVGTTTSDSLMTIAGDVKVTGKIKAQGGYENPLDCPIFQDSPFVFGHKAWPTDYSLARFSGFVPLYGVVINEASAGNDERLIWENCTRGGILPVGSEPRANLIGFTLPEILDGNPSTIFKAGPRSELNPAFRYAVGNYDTQFSVLRLPIANTTAARTAFCQELGLELDTSESLYVMTLPGGSTCKNFNTSTNIWESVSCTSAPQQINCKL